ncbi:HotDog domain-containing protein [Pseudomassariella vexata]|uniref:HotDog domain-containing protein n=1 Tax=Pseudomassariella vexata TaxID=1141098 RepID=A0A1Y2E4L2_9PEZI|nr:HotDog domain-containing protein [Pseudomassariella vexata]ORY66503.1 HotDog domain-containing protein [Pseudomassariella vexata]
MSRVLLRKPPTADIHNNARLPLSRRFASSVTASGSASTASPPPLAQPKSLLRRTATVFALGVTFTSLGFAIMAAPALPALNGLLAPPTDAETLKLFTPTDPQEEEVEAFITNSWLAKKMRSKPEFSESRPHLKMPAPFRTNSLTTGTLMGPNRVVVPPFVWAEEGGKSLVSISFLGSELCGYPGIVHGGILATMLDEGLAKCCLAALPHNVGMTANLNINYKAPAMAESYVVLRATTTKVDGRKAWVEGRIETLVPEGETPVVLADATALFISPRQAAMMANVYPTT